MQIIILAAGKGSRMKSVLPKVMHEVSGKAMLEHVVENCKEITDDLVLVYSDHLKPHLDQFKDRCKIVKQNQQKGTAHAVLAAKDLFDEQETIAVIYGDNPLITPDIISGLLKHTQDTNSKATTLAFRYDKPNQYGRIIVDKNGDFESIVETKFASEEQKKITLCNSGIMAFAPGILSQYIEKCTKIRSDNPEREFYLTDIIEICKQAGEKVSYYELQERERVVGVNTQEELAKANELIHKI
ncbi:MAG: hypothetical protein DGJ47_000221 [Rickettsiaceae bacterium]